MNNKLSKIIVAMLTVAMVFTLAGCSKSEEAKATNTQTEVAKEADANKAADTDKAADESEELLSGKYYVTIEFENEKYAPITMELDADAAPITVTNFMGLVNSGFYDGLTFHRIIDGFMIQGGDPTGTGMGGSDKEIKGEFAFNGIDNTIPHLRGAVSMARSQMPNSASSQFFICHQDSTFLDGQYAAFGNVISGIETVDAICIDTPVLDNNGTVAPADQPVMSKVYEVSGK